MNEAILGGLDILLHSGLERQVRIGKYLPWPHGLIFVCHQALNHQMPGRSTHRWQLFLPLVRYRYETQVHVERLAGLISCSNSVFG